ncbi:MAG: four helix bundle protein [bacterium]
MSSYRDLDVYRLAHALGVACHKMSMILPKYELYETGSQLRRASKSVSANIVEGYGRRRYKAEYIRYLIFAHASLEESIEWLEYIETLHEAVAEQARQLRCDADTVGAKLNRFIQSVERQHLPGVPEKGSDA